MPPIYDQHRPTAAITPRNIATEMADGFRFVFRNHILRWLLVLMFIANLGQQGIQTLVLYVLREENGLDEVTILQGDIVELEEQLLPDRIKVCLMDVDLAAPIEAGLEKIWARVVSGGTVLVDDCEEDTDWRGARHGYRRFCATHGLEERYEAGFGVLGKPSL